MVSLAKRRDLLCLKFAKKSLKVENFGHLFPISTKTHEMKTRHNDIYKVNKGYSKRYMQSAIPSMQRILNRDKQELNFDTIGSNFIPLKHLRSLVSAWECSQAARPQHGMPDRTHTMNMPRNTNGRESLTRRIKMIQIFMTKL